MEKVRVAVLGSTGYVGIEIVELLNSHPNVDITFLGSESTKDEHFVGKRNKIYNDLPKLKYNSDFNTSKSDIVFLALPHNVSNKFVRDLYGTTKIIDLSADFRIKNYKIYKENYGDNHSCPEYLDKFTYGLPEIFSKKINTSKYIAVPGCYPTSILLPLYPLIKNKLINTKNIIIDSKSGYSGAGKKFNLNNIKKNEDFNFYNYNTNNHRHMCEIKQELDNIAGTDTEFSFNPHILPNFRGMMSTIYCEISKKYNKNDLIFALESFCNQNQFVHLLEDNIRLDFNLVQNTNHCYIKLFPHSNEDKIIIVSVIDNLVKGAAGQAIQCFNIMYNYNQDTALNR